MEQQHTPIAKVESNDSATRVDPREVFVHILAIVTLYASAISFLMVLFQLINVRLPDAVAFSGFYSYQSALSMIRFALSTLIVVFPVYFFTARFLNKTYKNQPEKRQLRIRKWLVYLTLFVAALVIIGDFISVIYSLLNGELTLRFVLKVVSVLFVAGSVFGYYLLDLRDEISRALWYFRYVVPVIIFLAVVAGFVVAGSPHETRLREFDERRANDLYSLQSNVIEYWRAKGVLPTTLLELKDETRGVSVPQDPETDVPYEYIVTDQKKLTFSLCAAFARPSYGHEIVSKPAPMPRDFYYDPGSEYWQHPEGKHCFARTIDPSFYQPLKSSN